MAALTPQTVIAWHDRTTEQQDALADEWAAKGFRPLSLSIYGTPQSPRYVAVMVKRPAVIATRTFYSRTFAQMDAIFDQMAADGYGPFILTATGPAEDARFAGSFTPMPRIPLTKLRLTPARFRELNAEQQAAGNMLLWADAFGTPTDPRFTAIWGPNPNRVAWNTDAVDDTAAVLQQRFDAVVGAGARPALRSMTPAGRHFVMFVDSAIGRWESRPNLTSAEYQTAFETFKADGLQPLHVSASGAGSGARFSAVFATRDDTLPRTFRGAGPRTVAAIDTAMEQVMRDINLRGCALAVVRGTRLVYAKGYTLAESSYPDVQPTTRFRQASVSKTFAAAAAWRLIQQDDLTLDTTLQSVLHLTQPDGSAPEDDRFGDITVRHLLESTSGVDQGLMWDAVQAAQAAGASLPATPRQVARYITQFDLAAAPGTPTNVVYGNTDYFLLSQVVAERAGAATFEAALKTLVLDRLHMTRTRGSRSLTAAQAADEARHHMTVYNPASGWPLYPFETGASDRSDDRPLVSTHYGTYDYEMFDGCGGLSSAVVDVARLGAMLSDRTNNPLLTATTIDAWLSEAADATDDLSGPDAHGYHGFDWCEPVSAANHTFRCSKGGWLPGQGSSLRVTTGAFTYAFAQNGNRRADSTLSWLDAVSPIVEAHAWPAGDLFPEFGMPSLSPFVFHPAGATPVAQRTERATVERVAESMARQRFRRRPLVRPTPAPAPR